MSSDPEDDFEAGHEWPDCELPSLTTNHPVVRLLRWLLRI